MNVTGPAQIATIQRPDEISLGLRLNQRLAAEILKVTGDRVALVLEGVRVVAQLTTPEQAAALSERRFAQFIVKELAGPVITIQLVQPGQPTPTTPAAPPPAAQIIPQLLQQAGIPVNEATVTISQALLSQGLQASPELVAHLQHVLTAGASQASPGRSAQAGWGPGDAQVAAALKALGLPLSPATLALFQGQLAPLTELVGGLRSRLQAFLRGRPPPAQADLAQKSLALLESLAIDWSAGPAELAEMLRKAACLLGKSLEHELVQRKGDSGHTLMALAQLRRELAHEGSSPLVEQIDRFIEAARRAQFVNSEPESSPVKGQWLRLDLPLAANAIARESHPTHLRIAYRPAEDGKGQAVIDPAHTRLVLQVDLGEAGAVQVDLSVAGYRIGAQVTTTGEALRDLAERELPFLAAGLERLGYTLQTARCEVSSLEAEGIHELSNGKSTGGQLYQISIQA
jgi:hypothetical protein